MVGDGRPAAEEADEPVTAPVVIRLSEVAAVPIKWLWSSRIPMGRITLLAGMPGLGKSLLTTELAAHISRGLAWPDGPVPPQGDTLLITAEDAPADTLRPGWMPPVPTVPASIT